MQTLDVGITWCVSSVLSFDIDTHSSSLVHLEIPLLPFGHMSQLQHIFLYQFPLFLILVMLLLLHSNVCGTIQFEVFESTPYIDIPRERKHAERAYSVRFLSTHLTSIDFAM